MSGGITGGYWAIALVLVSAALFLGRLPSPSILLSATDETDKQVDNILVGLIASFSFSTPEPKWVLVAGYLLMR